MKGLADVEQGIVQRLRDHNSRYQLTAGEECNYDDSQTHPPCIGMRALPGAISASCAMQKMEAE